MILNLKTGSHSLTLQRFFLFLGLHNHRAGAAISEFRKARQLLRGAIMNNNQQIDVYLVCNARYHDTNFARLELLKLLAENENINTQVAASFSDIESIANSTLLLTYACDLRPTIPEQEAL